MVPVPITLGRVQHPGGNVVRIAGTAAGAVDLGALHELLCDVRNRTEVAERMRSDPDEILDAYDLPDNLVEFLVPLDVVELYRLGVNPYLLFFAALELGMPRDEYYRRIKSSSEGSA